MKGLFIKDYYLISQNKKFFLIYLLCVVFMSFSIDVSFIAGYVSLLMGIIGLSTLSYDEHDNGMTFLMTLPVDPKTYVREKFLFILILEGIGLLFGGILVTISLLKDGRLNEFPRILPFLLSASVASMLGILSMLPIELKYGAEKGRVVMMVIYGAAAALGVILGKISKSGRSLLASFADKLDALPQGVLIVFLTALVLLILYLLYLLSIRIMTKKEF